MTSIAPIYSFRSIAHEAPSYWYRNGLKHHDVQFSTMSSRFADSMLNINVDKLPTDGELKF